VDTPLSEARKLLEVNYLGAFNVSQVSPSFGVTTYAEAGIVPGRVGTRFGLGRGWVGPRFGLGQPGSNLCRYLIKADGLK